MTSNLAIDTNVVIPELLENIRSLNFGKEKLNQTLLELSLIISDYLGSCECCIVLNNSEGIPSSHYGSDMNVNFDSNLVKEVIKTGKPKTESYGHEHLLCAAITTKNEVQGIIYAARTSNIKWNANKLKVVEFIGYLTGMELNNLAHKENSQSKERLAMAGRIIVEISHSVKNLLQMVGGAAEVIDLGLQKKEMDRVNRSWSILKPNLDRLRKFMLDMLDYSKERPLEIRECDFNKMIQDAIESLKSQLKQISRLNIQIDPKMPIVRLDSRRILDMALNIILNAIDIVDDRDGVVSVQTQYIQSGKMIIFKVTDNGPGMTDDMKDKLFVPFESSKNGFGTGLGMAIAKQIVDAHNGKIEVESELGKGTSIIIKLPAVLSE